ncbi:MAG: GTP 3',8-cyclase MoaA [Clostridia bacterium]|nr:GTP 3',8-cyclase MoaA [Clostridia bacterium]NCC79914.1 GTP 3',8-cyclase MoaA [Clostridia bacterium]
MLDSYGRNIDYMRISITDRCNLRCQYCTPEDLPSIGHAEILRFEEILDIARYAVSLGITKFKITGGEPLVRKGYLFFLERLKTLPGVEQVTLTTNGVLLEDALPDLVRIGIDGVNISLDTQNPETFSRITRRDDFHKVWSAFLACQASGIRTKINTVLLKGINDMEFADLCLLAKNYCCDVRFIEIMPIGYGKGFQGYDRSMLLPLLRDLHPSLEESTTFHGNGPATYVSIPDFQGSIGFIDAIHGKFCSQCNRIRLTSDGMLKLCLYYKNSLDLKTLIRNQASESEVIQAMKDAIFHKPQEHQFHHNATEGIEELKKMSQIGG